jgi:hypothetical protein
VVCFGGELVVGRDYLEKQAEEPEMEMKWKRNWRKRKDKSGQLKESGTYLWEVREEQMEMPGVAD